MKPKTRGFYIRRKERIITEDAKGNKKETVSVKLFPCKYNAAVTNSHRMIKVEHGPKFDW